MKQWLIVTTCLFLLLGGCKPEQQESRQIPELPAQKVSTVQAELTEVHNAIELMGTIQSVYRAEISAKVSGTITELAVDLGTEVQKGDLLVKISAGEIDAQLQQSRAQLDQAKRNLERERKLLRRNAATPEKVKSLEEMLAISRAAYDEARTMQSYTRVLAPFNGRVTRKSANIGDLATPGKPLLNLEDEKHLQVVTDIPEAMILQVKKGDVLPVIVPAARLTVPGTVAEVAPTANPTTRSAPVKLDIDRNQLLRPGQFARVALMQRGANTLLVPWKALVPIGQMERLFVAEDGIAHLRLVRTGSRYNDHIEILSGLKPGELVIIEGQESLQDRQSITVE